MTSQKGKELRFDEETYESEALDKAKWYPDDYHENCHRGVLILTFKSNRHYLYDLPVQIFEAMENRAEEYEEYEHSSWQFFQEIAENCFPNRERGNLYEEKQTGGRPEDLLRTN